MEDKPSTSGAGEQELMDPALVRGMEESEATTSSASNQHEVEDRLTVNEEEMNVLDLSKREDLAVLSATKLNFCVDLAKAIRDESVKLLVERCAGSAKPESAVEIRNEDKEKEQVLKEVHYFLEKARTLQCQGKVLELLLVTLHKACGLAVSLLSVDEAFKALEDSGEILHDFLSRVESCTSLLVVYEMHLKAIEVFLKYVAKLGSAYPARSIRVTDRFHQCTAAYQNKVRCEHYSQSSAEKAKKILKKHFNVNHNGKSLHSRTCFYLARHFFPIHQQEALNSSLKQTDEFIRRNVSTTASDASIDDTFPKDIFINNTGRVTVNFMKHIASILKDRSNCTLTSSKKILKLLCKD